MNHHVGSGGGPYGRHGGHHPGVQRAPEQDAAGAARPQFARQGRCPRSAGALCRRGFAKAGEVSLHQDVVAGASTLEQFEIHQGEPVAPVGDVGVQHRLQGDPRAVLIPLRIAQRGLAHGGRQAALEFDHFELVVCHEVARRADRAG